MMYVIHTKSGCELSASNALKKLGFDVKVPEKIMNIHHKGVWRNQKYLIFTGYIFLDAVNGITPHDYYSIKNTDGVINFIGKGKPSGVTEAERQYINWLWNNGSPIEPSKVYKTITGYVMVMSGMLKKYPGEYIDYNLRQRRAKLKISICGVNHSVTLPIEVI